MRQFIIHFGPLLIIAYTRDDQKKLQEGDRWHPKKSTLNLLNYGLDKGSILDDIFLGSSEKELPIIYDSEEAAQTAIDVKIDEESLYDNAYRYMVGEKTYVDPTYEALVKWVHYTADDIELGLYIESIGTYSIREEADTVLSGLQGTKVVNENSYRVATADEDEEKAWEILVKWLHRNEANELIGFSGWETEGVYTSEEAASEAKTLLIQNGKDYENSYRRLFGSSTSEIKETVWQVTASWEVQSREYPKYSDTRTYTLTKDPVWAKSGNYETRMIEGLSGGELVELYLEVPYYYSVELNDKGIPLMDDEGNPILQRVSAANGIQSFRLTDNLAHINWADNTASPRYLYIEDDRLNNTIPVEAIPNHNDYAESMMETNEYIKDVLDIKVHFDEFEGKENTEPGEEEYRAAIYIYLNGTYVEFLWVEVNGDPGRHDISLTSRWYYGYDFGTSVKISAYGYEYDKVTDNDYLGWSSTSFNLEEAGDQSFSVGNSDYYLYGNTNAYQRVQYGQEKKFFSEYDHLETWSSVPDSRVWDQVVVDDHWQYQGAVDDKGQLVQPIGYDNDYWLQNLVWQNTLDGNVSAERDANGSYLNLPGDLPSELADSPNFLWPEGHAYVRVDDFEDRYHHAYYMNANMADIWDPRQHLNYQMVSQVFDIFEDVPVYAEVTETRSFTKYVERTNWLEETILNSILLIEFQEVEAPVQSSNDSDASLLTERGSIRIASPHNTRINGVLDSAEILDVTADHLDYTTTVSVNVETHVNTMFLNITEPGDAYIHESDSLILHDMTLSNGTLTLIAEGSIDRTEIQTINANKIILEAGGTIDVHAVGGELDARADSQINLNTEVDII